MSSIEIQKFNENVGRILKQIRINSGYSTDVVNKLENMQFSLNEIESGKQSVRCCDLFQLLKIYSCSNEQLLFFCTLKFNGCSHEIH